MDYVKSNRGANKMVKKSKNLEKEFLQRLTYCPTINKRVIANDWMRISVSNVQATWWHCPMCAGWHVLMLTSNKEKWAH